MSHPNGLVRSIPSVMLLCAGGASCTLASSNLSIVSRKSPGVQGCNATRRQARGSSDKAQEPGLVSRLQLRQNCEEMPYSCALGGVPAAARSTWSISPAVKLLLSPQKKFTEPLSCSLHPTKPDSTKSGSANCRCSLLPQPGRWNEDRTMVKLQATHLHLAQAHLLYRFNGYQMQSCQRDSSCSAVM